MLEANNQMSFAQSEKSKDLEYLRPGPAASLLGVSKTTLYAWLQSGHLTVRPIKLGARATVFCRAELDTFIASRPRTTPAGN